MSEETPRLPVTGPAPCPFCGVAPGLTKVADGPIFIIHCTNDACGVRCETSASTPENARDAWNARSGAAQSPDTRVREALAVRLRAAAQSFEGQRAWHANHVDGDCEPHDSWQLEMDDASKAAIEAADILAALPQPGAVEPTAMLSKYGEPAVETAINAIVAWQANKATTFTPTDILNDFGDAILAQLRAVPKSPALDPALIKHMVDRFLGWKLPVDFKPDCGIVFNAPSPNKFNPRTPYGTNLFDATQADAMVRYMVDGAPSPALDPATVEAAIECIRDIADCEYYDLSTGAKLALAGVRDVLRRALLASGASNADTSTDQRKPDGWQYREKGGIWRHADIVTDDPNLEFRPLYAGTWTQRCVVPRHER